MKIKILITTLLFALALNAQAQQSQTLTISLDESTNDNDPKQMKLVINIGPSLAEGMFIDLPPDITPVIKSIKLNGNELWLINSQDLVEKDNVIGWYAKDNGVILHYVTGLEGELEVQIVFDIIKFNKGQNTQVAVSSVTRNEEEIIVDNSIQAETDISNIQTLQPEEN